MPRLRIPGGNPIRMAAPHVVAPPLLSFTDVCRGGKGASRMRRSSETPRQDAVGERFAAGLDRATKIGEGNKSFKRSVLIAAYIAVTTACTPTGDKKNDVADGAVTVTAAAKEAPPVANSSPAVPPAMVASNADGIVDYSAPETSAPDAESVAQPTDPAPP